MVFLSVKLIDLLSAGWFALSSGQRCCRQRSNKDKETKEEETAEKKENSEKEVEGEGKMNQG